MMMIKDDIIPKIIKLVTGWNFSKIKTPLLHKVDKYDFVYIWTTDILDMGAFLQISKKNYCTYK